MRNKLNKERRDQLIRFIELFEGRNLFIVPQVLAELYSLLKREAKPSESKLKHWLELLEEPHIKHIIEKYINKEDILKERKYLEFGFTDIALMKTLNKNNFLLSTDFKLINFCKFKGLNAYHIEEIFVK